MRRLLAILALATMASGCPGPSSGPKHAEWPVMGTIASVKYYDNKDVPLDNWPIEDARRIFADVERLLNAHDPESELSRLARLSDAEVLAQCDPMVRECYRAAFRLRDQTGGRFNPRWRGPGTMDLGAIAKGFAVDLAADKYLDFEKGHVGYAPYGGWRLLVDLGGNLKARGAKGERWKVGIAGTDRTLELRPGEACATSGEYYRGKHIRDGRDGSELTNTVYSVTVVHPSSAMLADGLSTVMFILGREEGEKFLAKHYPEARVIWCAIAGDGYESGR